MKLAKAASLFTLVSMAAWAQVNIGEATLPFTMSTVATFELPWRIAFLPDGRMLVTEKIGPIWLVTQDGQKSQVNNTPAVYWQGQSGMFGVFLSPTYATDQKIYLTYSEPGDYGGGLVLARAKLNTAGNGGPGATGPVAVLQNLEVLWRQLPKGKGGQEGAQIAFAPDGKSLFLTVGDRQSQLRKNRRIHHSANRSCSQHRSREDRAGGEHLYVHQPEPHAGRNLGQRSPDSVWHGIFAHWGIVGSGAWSARRR